MIEFQHVKPWVVITQSGGQSRAWPVQDTEEGGVGQAIMAIHALLEQDYEISLLRLEEGGWLISGTPTTGGYPPRYTVQAWVLKAAGEEEKA